MRRLLERLPGLTLSVSCTTRAPRPGEVDGRDYRFVSPPEFDRLIEEGAFLEWAEVYGHRSGTLLAPVAEELERGRDVLLEIDVQGAAQVRSRMPRAILVFLVPPSKADLAERLRARGSEDRQALDRRLREADEEMAKASWFDHVVVNDDIDRAAATVAAIIADERGEQPANSPG